ncbi:hypothetical protein BJ085DRAFT_39907 [Dimargaris cristalligena]|uniref:TM7S3/TM198-like domain-containing protein n=1 Tax=Dimargaris cristalligena TaxID=215637 RepID=A0A4P9ZKN9_9FUNG|nr:hypothetical protein BJ085DRAFT_39907 [Dimargaris cristalligena]|eukprot:RKP33665.1 hypothetical protein BJ085DRAFT_39907 [Dimargaris cristalligena]
MLLTEHPSLPNWRSASTRFWLYMAAVLACLTAAWADDGSGGSSKILAQDIIAGILLIIIGFMFCFFGRRLFKVVLFLAGFCVLGLLVLLACFRIRPPREDENTRAILYYVAAIIGGIIGGCISVCVWFIGLALIGGLGGFTLSVWLLSLKDGGLITSTWGRVLLMVLLIIAGMIAIFFLEKHVLIIATALWGAYAMMIGIDSFAKTGFREQLSAFFSGDTAAVYQTNAKVYAMIGSTIALALIGAIVQYRSFRGKHR